MRAAWERSDEQRGHSVARVAEIPGGWECHGTEVLAGPDPAVSCTFAIRLDGRWHTRRVRVSAVADDVRTLDLVADGEGHWTRDGLPASDLDGCTDVDIAATPLTNTFPIRRLADVAVGYAVTLDVAWVDVPSLTVGRVGQTYTRLGPERWRYQDDHHGAFELTVDSDGIVVDYEGFATRVWP